MTRECLPQSSSSDKVLDNQISKLSSNTHSNQCFVLIALPVNQPPEVTLLKKKLPTAEEAHTLLYSLCCISSFFIVHLYPSGVFLRFELWCTRAFQLSSFIHGRLNIIPSSCHSVVNFTKGPSFKTKRGIGQRRYEINSCRGYEGGAGCWLLRNKSPAANLIRFWCQSMDLMIELF